MRETTSVGQLWDLVQGYLDRQPFDVSERQLARKLGYASSSTFDNWREPKSLPQAQALVRFSVLSGTPYQRVLDAVLADVGYLPEPAVSDESLARPRSLRAIPSDGPVEATPTHPRAARDIGKPSRGQRVRADADLAGEPLADDPGDMEPR